MRNDCVFCDIDSDLILVKGRHITAFTALFPIADCHMVLMTNRHIEAEEEMSEKEIIALHKLRVALAGVIKSKIKKNYYFGFNGEVTKTTVKNKIKHLHYHLVPLDGQDLKNSYPAKIVKKCIESRSTDGLQDAYSMLIRRPSIRNLVPGMGDYVTRQLDRKYEEAGGWAKKLRASVKNINLTDI